MRPPWASLAAQYEGWAAATDDQPPSYLGPTAFLGNMVSLSADGTLAAVNGFMHKPANAEFRFFFEIGVFQVQGGRLAGVPRVLVPFDEATGLGHFYPTWSPDGRFIAFASAEGESFNNGGTALRLVRAEGGPYSCPGPDCWELTRGTRYTPAEAKTVLGHSTWPKFTPFAL